MFRLGAFPVTTPPAANAREEVGKRSPFAQSPQGLRYRGGGPAGASDLLQLRIPLPAGSPPIRAGGRSGPLP